MNGVAWQRLADGLQVIGFGVFLLLTTQGLLPWSFWAEALSYWPVLLVGAGLRMVSERSRLPWAVLLSPLLVIGTLAFVARGHTMERLPGEWVDRAIERPRGAERWTLSARLSAARLDLRAVALSGGLLAEGRCAARGEPGRLELEGAGPAPVLRLAGGRGRAVFGPQPSQVWELRIDPSLPLGVELEGVLRGGRLELKGARLTGGGLEGAFNDVELRLPRPETEVTLHLKGVFSSLRLVVPASTPVRVRAEGLFNEVDRGGRAAPGGPGFDVRVEGVMNRVEVVEG